MSHRTLINGTGYDILGGRTLINGTGYDIKGGRTLINGTGYDISFGPPLAPVFADNDWATIIWACQNRKVPATWTVGSQKNMLINGKNYPIDIIGVNHDDYSDNSGKAPLTFQMHDCYYSDKNMNGINTNAGGWGSCAMRNTHLPAIKDLMPTEVKAGIKQVRKLSSAGETSSTINTTDDHLFLLSEVEIFGTVTYSRIGEGDQYAYYRAGNSKVKNRNGSAHTWWERSPYSSNSTTFCIVNVYGSANSYYASNSYGVAFGFCF